MGTFISIEGEVSGGVLLDGSDPGSKEEHATSEGGVPVVLDIDSLVTGASIFKRKVLLPPRLPWRNTISTPSQVTTPGQWVQI